MNNRFLSDDIVYVPENAGYMIVKIIKAKLDSYMYSVLLDHRDIYKFKERTTNKSIDDYFRQLHYGSIEAIDRDGKRLSNNPSVIGILYD